MKFHFFRRPTTLPNGFDLGDVRVEGEGGVATSAGHVPDQGMMIYVALTDLLDGLQGLLAKSRREFEFIGTDSSFRLVFRHGKGDRLNVKYRGGTIEEAPATEIASAALASAGEFLSNHPLPESDPVAGDISAAISELRAFLNDR